MCEFACVVYKSVCVSASVRGDAGVVRNLTTGSSAVVRAPSEQQITS